MERWVIDRWVLIWLWHFEYLKYQNEFDLFIEDLLNWMWTLTFFSWPKTPNQTQGPGQVGAPREPGGGAQGASRAFASLTRLDLSIPGHVPWAWIYPLGRVGPPGPGPGHSPTTMDTSWNSALRLSPVSGRISDNSRGRAQLLRYLMVGVPMWGWKNLRPSGLYGGKLRIWCLRDPKSERRQPKTTKN